MNHNRNSETVGTGGGPAHGGSYYGPSPGFNGGGGGPANMPEPAMELTITIRGDDLKPKRLAQILEEQFERVRQSVLAGESFSTGCGGGGCVSISVYLQMKKPKPLTDAEIIKLRSMLEGDKK